jgi:peptidoglycan/xylan/chitin deacetylase (PgdA/CDA1 family)
MKRVLLSVFFVTLVAISVGAQQVAITLDDLPEHGDLPPHMTRLGVARSFLNEFKKEKLPPVYGFVNAVALEDMPSEIRVLQAWRAAGQPLGSHTYTHLNLSAVSVEKYEADIARDEPLLEKLMKGEDWRWFRYPYLREGDTLEKRDAIRSYMKQRGYRTAQVSLNFEDWAWNDPYARCSEKHNAKEIAWLHDSYLAAADTAITQYRELTHTLYGRDISYVLLLHIGPFDAKMFPELVALLRRRGFSFVSLPEAMKDSAYAEDPNVAMPNGLTFQEQVAKARQISFVPDTSSLARLDTVCR